MSVFTNTYTISTSVASSVKFNCRILFGNLTGLIVKANGNGCWNILFLLYTKQEIGD